jgi:hypothetical protein
MADPDPGALIALRRVRHAETDAARRDLGLAMAEEAAAAAREAAVRQELDAARRMAGEFDRETFAAWFSRARAEWERLATESRAAEARAAEARLVLARRRVAETAAEAAVARAEARKRADAAHREQLMLEDVARTLKQIAR